jgi:hypothetical protein
MSVIYHGYSDMPETKYNSFPFIDLAESTMKFKKNTTFNPIDRPNKRFTYTGTEQHPLLCQKSVFQRSINEGFQMPVFEYYNRYQVIQPRPDYVMNVDTSDASVKRMLQRQYGSN